MGRARSGIAALVVSLALLGASATVASAASFSVLGEQKGDGNRDGNTFVFHEKLTTDGVHVGRVRAELTFIDNRTFKAKGLFRFHGGKIRVAGTLSRGSAFALPITGGRGRYHGISGRVLIDDDLERGFTGYKFKYSL